MGDTLAENHLISAKVPSGGRDVDCRPDQFLPQSKYVGLFVLPTLSSSLTVITIMLLQEFRAIATPNN